MLINVSHPKETTAASQQAHLFGRCSSRIERRERIVIQSNFVGVKLEDNPSIILSMMDHASAEAVKKAFMDQKALKTFLDSINNGGRVYANNPRYSILAMQDYIKAAYPNAPFIVIAILYQLIKPFGLVDESVVYEFRRRFSLDISPSKDEIIKQVLAGKLIDSFSAILNREIGKFEIPKRQFSLLAFEARISQILQMLVSEIDLMLYNWAKFETLFSIARLYFVDSNIVKTNYGPIEKNPGMVAFMGNGTLLRCSLNTTSVSTIDVRNFEINDVANEFMRGLVNMPYYTITADRTIPAVLYRSYSNKMIYGAILGEKIEYARDIEVFAAYSDPNGAGVSNRGKKYVRNCLHRTVHLQRMKQFETKGQWLSQSHVASELATLHESLAPAIFNSLKGNLAKGRFVSALFNEWLNTLIDRIFMATSIFAVSAGEIQNHGVDQVSDNSSNPSKHSGKQTVEATFGEYTGSSLLGEAVEGITYSSDIHRIKLIGDTEDVFIVAMYPNYEVLSDIQYTPFVDGGYYLVNPYVVGFSFSTEVDKVPLLLEDTQKAPMIKGNFFYGDLFTDCAISKLSMLDVSSSAPSIGKNSLVTLNLFGAKRVIPDSALLFIGYGWVDIANQINSLMEYGNEVNRHRFISEIPGFTAAELKAMNNSIAKAIDNSIAASLERIIIKLFTTNIYMRGILLDAVTMMYMNQSSALIDRYSAVLNTQVIGECSVSLFFNLINLMAQQFGVSCNPTPLLNLLSHRQHSIGVSIGQALNANLE